MIRGDYSELGKYNSGAGVRISGYGKEIPVTLYLSLRRDVAYLD
jgi:hypothetical protein